MKQRELKRITVVPPRPMKTCNSCRRELPLLAFTKDRLNKDGLSYHCVTCKRVKNAERRNDFVRGSSY